MFGKDSYSIVFRVPSDLKWDIPEVNWSIWAGPVEWTCRPRLELVQTGLYPPIKSPSTPSMLDSKILFITIDR